MFKENTLNTLLSDIENMLKSLQDTFHATDVLQSSTTPINPFINIYSRMSICKPTQRAAALDPSILACKIANFLEQQQFQLHPEKNEPRFSAPSIAS